MKGSGSVPETVRGCPAWSQTSGGRDDKVPSQCHGNQVHSEVAVRKSDAAEAAGSSEMAVPTIQLPPSPCLTPSASLSSPVLMHLMRKPAALRMLSFLLLNISRRFNRGVL